MVIDMVKCPECNKEIDYLLVKCISYTSVRLNCPDKGTCDLDWDDYSGWWIEQEYEFHCPECLVELTDDYNEAVGEHYEKKEKITP